MNDEVQRRVIELVDRHRLTAGVSEQLEAILESLALDDQAPTTVRDPLQAVDVHIADALVALELDEVRSAVRVVDIGAGAGVPGLPIAAAMPQSTVALVESQSRKCAFIERVRIHAGIENARVVDTRVEQWPAGVGVHDLALARAVALAPVVLEYAAPLLRIGGTLVDWRGRRNPEEERQAINAAALLGLARRTIRHVQPFPSALEHHLHVYLKVAPTPERFPRRPGVARKRPLGVANVAATAFGRAAQDDRR